MLIKEIMHSANIHTIDGNLSVQEAAIKMAELNIGALIIGTTKKMEGIFSERDILKKVIGNNLSPENTLVKEVMSTQITVVEEIEMTNTALSLMQAKKFRHLPVVDEDGICVGMVGIRDLMKAMVESLEKENKALTRHIIEENNWN